MVEVKRCLKLIRPYAADRNVSYPRNALKLIGDLGQIRGEVIPVDMTVEHLRNILDVYRVFIAFNLNVNSFQQKYRPLNKPVNRRCQNQENKQHSENIGKKRKS